MSTLKIMPEYRQKCDVIAAFCGCSWESVYHTALRVSKVHRHSVMHVLNRWEHKKSMRWPLPELSAEDRMVNDGR